MPRDAQGKFIQKPDGLGKTIGLRVRKDAEVTLDQLAEQKGLRRTVLCRILIEGLLNPKYQDVVREILAEAKANG